MDCAAMRSVVIGDFQEPYGAVLGRHCYSPGSLRPRICILQNLSSERKGWFIRRAHVVIIAWR
jgi:hypothetical protein